MPAPGRRAAAGPGARGGRRGGPGIWIDALPRLSQLDV